jgi:hypothetical protein
MKSPFFTPLPLLALTLALGLSACGKKPAAPAPEAPAAPATGVFVDAPADAPPPPPTTAPAAAAADGSGAATPATTLEIDYSKMSNEDKYMQEMASSITTYIQDHVRGKGRMPRDAQDILALKIMDRLEVPPNYTLVIDQKTGQVSFKKKK